MESLLTISGAFLFLFAGMALPLAIILAAVYMSVKRRHYNHVERMKMIECGLVRENEDFIKNLSSMRQFEHSMMFEIAFYALLLFTGFLFTLFSAYSVLYFALLKLPVKGGLSLFAIMAGILATFFLILMVRLLPALYRQRKLLLAACLLLGLTFSGLFVQKLGQIPTETLKEMLKAKPAAQMQASDSTETGQQNR